MKLSVVDRKIRCPYCDEPMNILLDLSAGDQSYVEDCQVCCQPMQIAFQADDGSVANLQVDCAG